MTTAPVSVVMAARNAARFIEESLRSAVGQTLSPERIVVIDDGSHDDTAVIASRIDERIVVHSQPHHGIGASRDAGLARSETDLVAFLDADDIWLPEKLEMQLSALHAHPEADAVFCLFDEFLDGVDPQTDGVRAPRTAQSAPLACGALLRRSVIERVGAFESSQIGDWMRWWGRARALGINEHTVPKVLWLRRIHRLNNSHVRADGGRTYLALVRAHRREVLEARGGDEGATR